MDELFFDIAGWVGTIMAVATYTLLSIDKIKNGFLYQILSFVSASLIAVGLLPKNAWFSFSLEIVWALIAIIAMARLGIKRKRKR